ncbi:hypothetical protein MMC24_005524 [Lignoscripta atroalba]|nr:hypothetical protein [Lignoscripta atroalba]
MLHTPSFTLAISTAKLDISRLLKSSPSPPPSSPGQNRPSLPRSTSVPGPVPASLARTESASHRTSTCSNLSTSSTYTAASSTAPHAQFPTQLQTQVQSHRQSLPLPPLSSLSSHPSLPTSSHQHQHTPSKRPPPTSAHPSASPAKRQSKWSSEEDALIIELRGSGMKWEDISKRFPGRSAISCRLHYQNYLEKRSEWDEEKKNRLARLYERLKPEIWTPLAIELGIPWRAVEAMHWHLGEADMARRAGVSPFSLAAGGGVGSSLGQQQHHQQQVGAGVPPSRLGFPPPGGGGYVLPAGGGGGGGPPDGYRERMVGGGESLMPAPTPMSMQMPGGGGGGGSGSGRGNTGGPVRERRRDVLSLPLPSVAEFERGVVAFAFESGRGAGSSGAGRDGQEGREG